MSLATALLYYIGCTMMSFTNSNGVYISGVAALIEGVKFVQMFRRTTEEPHSNEIGYH